MIHLEPKLNLWRNRYYDDISGNYAMLSSRIAKDSGMGVLAVDYGGYGDSEGTPGEAAFMNASCGAWASTAAARLAMSSWQGPVSLTSMGPMHCGRL